MTGADRLAPLAGATTPTYSGCDGNGAATLTISNTGGSATYSGGIGDTSPANAVSLVQNGGATNILAGANTYRGTTTVNGGVLLINGSIASGAVTVNNGTLGGSGIIGGAVMAQTNGTLSPGSLPTAAIGILSVNSSVTLQPGSTTVMEINKSSLTNDQLLVSGSLNYGGTLVVTNLGGTLAGGDSFQLFHAGAFIPNSEVGC